MPNPVKDIYRQMRALPWERLWTTEVPRYNHAAPRERMEMVGVIRAVGVVFSESGAAEQKEEVRRWLLGLLRDPVEKIRRYAMAALPKIGVGPEEEAALLAALRSTTSEREKKFLAQALAKIGGAATLQIMGKEKDDSLRQAEQKVKAGIARRESPSAVRMDALLNDFANLRIHLRGRRGLEGIVREEVEASISARGKFRIAGGGKGLVAITPLAPFSLADLYAMRCFGTVGFVLGEAPHGNEADHMDALAAVIASPSSRRILEALTEGTIRYRLSFPGHGHQRSAVRQLASRVFELCPALLNDPRNVTWTMDICADARSRWVELRPNVTPDPRFYYRRKDVPAASHPQLAACMARLAGRVEREVIWDPFCGSGLELIESALLGGVERIHGTDRSAAAIAIARDNFAAVTALAVPTELTCCNFRDFATRTSLRPGSATLVITNPPLGMRVPVADLRGLFAELFAAAATVLQPGGRLVLANPLSKSPLPPSLELEFQQPVDFGGFDCRLEKYRKRA